jgi:hypothetical protein
MDGGMTTSVRVEGAREPGMSPGGGIVAPLNAFVTFGRGVLVGRIRAFTPKLSQRVKKMYVGLLFGPARVESEHLRIRVFIPNGEQLFDCDKLLIDKDGSLLLYGIAHQDDQGTRLELVAGFRPEGWCGIANEGKGTISEPVGFHPPQRAAAS